MSYTLHTDSIETNNLVVNGAVISNDKSDGVPIGTIHWFAGDTVPETFLLCNGALLNPNIFPKLFNVIGTKYGGDGETTFALPNLINRFIEGAETSGEYKQAGLPNITGNLNGVNGGGNSAYSWGFSTTSDGVFLVSSSNSSEYNRYGGVYYVEHGNSANFNASRCSPIYGNSETVQPNSLCLIPCIKAFDNTALDEIYDSGINLQQLIADFNKTTTECVDYIIDSYSDSNGNWYKKYKSGWLEQGGIATLESSGTQWISLQIPILQNKPYYGNVIFKGWVNGNFTNTVDFRSENTTTWETFYVVSNKTNFPFFYEVKGYYK